MEITTFAYLIIMRVRPHVLIIAASVSALSFFPAARAQSTGSSMAFLELPQSAHGAALGGIQVSLPTGNPSDFIQNPALLSRSDAGTVGLAGMSWMESAIVAGAQYCNALGERGSYAFNAMYVDYGTQDMTLSDATVTGTFSSKDMEAGAAFSYRLTDRLSGGITGKIISSRYASMTQVSVGVDLGLHYAIPDNGLDLGLAARNVGGQIKAFENRFQDLPFNLSAGMSWKMQHAPLRFTITFDELTKWRKSDFLFEDGKDPRFADMLKRHMAVGADILLSGNFYIALGCNLRTRAELSESGNRSFTGMSAGTGMKLNRMSFDISMGRYQVSGSSVLMNFAFRI